MDKIPYWAGLDVGSTTIKIAVVHPATRELIYSRYQRHNAEQVTIACTLLQEAHKALAGHKFILAVCGSGGLTIAEKLHAFFIQEVVANSIAIRAFYQEARVAIELGGQDAKVIFFHFDESAKQIVASDMRMNGSCAGGTGAFIDQVAELLHVNTDEFSALADRGKIVYDISGRCGVFAKTDIQPLLNQGAAPEDIALSTFHAIAKQTIGGLAQGMDIVPKVIFEGGPLHFNPRLVEVFRERLMLAPEDVIIPGKPEIIVAYGAALSVGVMFSDKISGYDEVRSLADLQEYIRIRGQAEEDAGTLVFFADSGEQAAFLERTRIPDFRAKNFTPGSTVEAYLGIDAGSTTSKFVLIDGAGEVIDKFYSNNHGDPLKVIKYGLVDLRDRYSRQGVALDIRGVGTTGYGELLFARAFHADYHTVETVAHARAAQQYAPGVTFILDIGGQDMKAINLKSGVVTGIVLNEACSAGCGSFIETYARSLGIPAESLAEYAFRAEHPSRLGSRCTVFMNSSIITEQKHGRTTEDILAGISRSIIENVFTKVIRISNLDLLGDTIVVQGGTFRNDAVLRAFEQYTGRSVIRPPFPGEMGAIGIALLTRQFIEEKQKADYHSSFIGLEKLDAFNYEKEPGLACPFCQNSCSRTVVTFNDGTRYITGNRCEKGEILGTPAQPGVREQLKTADRRIRSVPDMMQRQNELLFADYHPVPVDDRKNIKIGIPRTLEFWASMPFWRTVFQALGFDVVISKKSNYDIFEQGLRSVPSDTVCFPAKLAHGHVRYLINQGVDRIFMPMMIRMVRENRYATNSHVCAVVQGYPLIVARSDEPCEKHGVPFDFPAFHWYNDKLKMSQTVGYFHKTYGIDRRTVRKAVQEGEKAMTAYREAMWAGGREILESVRKAGTFAVLLAGRPYHADELVNHNISRHFTSLGIPVLNLDALPGLHAQELSRVRMETTIPFHTRMAGAALAACADPHIEIVQIVSFGCGHDAIISDEMLRLLRNADRELLIVKLDEGEAAGPLNIRIKSFIETIRVRREKQQQAGNRAVKPPSLLVPFPARFTKEDKPVRTILAPNLSPAFSYLISMLIRREGYKVEPLPLADARAIELGKRYVHNDICYPAQVNIGEALAMIEKGVYRQEEVAVGLAKNCEDCRAGQYAALARKALDEAGYPGIPIITTGTDTKNMHPGFKFSMRVQIGMLWGLAMMDSLEMMRRKTRPYEIVPGETDRVFQYYMQAIAETLPYHRKEAVNLFKEAVQAFNRIPVDRSVRRPRVCIIGEVLLNYHPVSNGNIERYLETHGMETILPSMVDFFRKGLIHEQYKSRHRFTPHPLIDYLMSSLTDRIYETVLEKIAAETRRFRYADPYASIHDLVKHIEDVINLSFIAGEGWLLPAEIIHRIREGVNAFVIVQPFGCLPNHIAGRGLMKAIKKKYPHVQIIALDYDPDTSFANVENRLQMLIITAKELEKERTTAADR